MVVNRRQVRDFAKAAGKLAKTDVLDAHTLAHFAAVMRPEPRPLPNEQTQTLAAILTRRRQLVEMLTAEKNRLGQARKPVRKSLRAHIAWLECEIAYIMKAIKAGILTVSTKTELEKAEAERGRVLSQLQARTAKADNVTTMLPNLKERFKTLVGNLAATPHHHVAKAREALKNLLGKTIALHPCADGAGRYLTAEVPGDYEGLLRLAIGKNKAGGGQGS